MTESLFREDSYLKDCTATVLRAADNVIVLDRTVFYASSGGQPGDTGRVELADGLALAVTGAVHPDGDRTRVLHLLAPGSPLPERGVAVRLALGANRADLVRQLVTESLILAAGGAALGVLFSLWTVGALPSFFPPEIARLPRMDCNARAHLLLAQLFWSVVWVPRYYVEDYPRLAEHVLDD